jgi:U3 small nucleolar RNA-associated protein 7
VLQDAHCWSVKVRSLYRLCVNVQNLGNGEEKPESEIYAVKVSRARRNPLDLEFSTPYSTAMGDILADVRFREKGRDPPRTKISSIPQPKHAEFEAHALQLRAAEAQNAYGRGRKISVKNIKDKKLRGNLKALEDKYKAATLKSRDAEILLEHDSGFLEPEGELEKTYKVRQDEIRNDVGVEAAKKGFELKLDDLGPYIGDYTRNGRSLLLAGRKGHISTMDWRAGTLGCELQLGETIRDAKWLHNNQYFAVSQKKYVYIYDHAGVEIHCLKKHIEVTHMEFLPYHFLLGTVVRICISN